MKQETSDVIIIGGGIIGVSLALELWRRGASVRVLERGEPGQEASHAAAGMLTAQDPDTDITLRGLASASAKMYRDWVKRIEAESGLKADFREDGTIYFLEKPKPELGEAISKFTARTLAPAVNADAPHIYVTDEASVDPPALMRCLLMAAKKSGVVVSHEHAVTEVIVESGIGTGVRCGNQTLSATVIVNSAGAWAGEIAGVNIPSLPVKGQMLAVVKPENKTPVIQHVVRNDEVYLVPRSDGRILIGATVERVGFNKQIEPERILRMRDEAAKLVPEVEEMLIQDSWAGLRPGTPDKLPILGETEVKNYFVATGHYRNGILLAPVTARVMAQMITGEKTSHDLSRFASSRFEGSNQKRY